MNKRTMNDCCKRNACVRHLANGVTARQWKKANGHVMWLIDDNGECLYHSIGDYFHHIGMEVWALMSDANEMLNFDLLLRDGYGIPERTIDAVMYDNKFEILTPYRLDIMETA